MVISHKHKFIFLATGKTGTTSMETLLKKYDDEGRKFHKHGRLSGPSTIIHPYTNTKKELNFDSSDYFKFCFVRNPWERMLSWYGQLQKTKFQIYPTSGIRKMLYELTNNYSFTDFLKNLPEEHFKHFSQSNFYLISGNLIDFIGKVENLQQDFDFVCNKIGIPQQQLPHKNATKHKHYTEYYDDETRQIVAEKYAKDIEYFGYEFGE
jgi:hypothetical protein